MEELGKFNLKRNVISNGLENYMSFTVNDKLSFIDSFQFLSSSLDSFVKNLNKNDFKYLEQTFDNKELDLQARNLVIIYNARSESSTGKISTFFSWKL